MPESTPPHAIPLPANPATAEAEQTAAGPEPGSIPPPDPPALVEIERQFVACYLHNGRNGAAAWRAVVDATAGRTASRRAATWLRRPRIAAALAAADAAARPHTQAVLDRYAISEQRVLDELASVAFTRAGDLLRLHPDGTASVDLSAMDDHQEAAIAEVTVDEYMDGKGPDGRPVKRIRLKLADKLRALNLLGATLGLWHGSGRAGAGPGASPSAADDRAAVEAGLTAGRGLSALLEEAERLAARSALGEPAPTPAPAADPGDRPDPEPMTPEPREG